MRREKRYIIVVSVIMLIEFILYLVVRNSSSLENMYYTYGFTWFLIVFGISAITRSVFPGILYFEKRNDTLHSIYFFSILGSNLLFLTLIYIAFNNYELELTDFANLWTLLSLGVGFTGVFTGLLLIGGGLKFWEGSAIFFTAIMTFARLLYFYGRYGLAIKYFYSYSFVTRVFTLDVLFFIFVGILQINYVRKIYRY